MVEDGDYVAIFNSIHRVMKGEKVLKQRGLKILLIPAPRVISSDCGLAIRYSETEKKMVEDALLDEDLSPEETYRKEKDAYVKLNREGA